MGRILAGVLFLAACGDTGIAPPGAHPPGGNATTEPGAAGVPTAQFAASVCGELSWTTTNGGTNAMDVAVVPRSFGAQVLEVPLAGGAISGYTLSKELNMDKVSPQITIDSGFTAVSASEIGGHLAAIGADASSLRVNVIADDLSKATEVAKILPGFVGKPAFQVSGGVSFLPVADDQGLRIEQFDGAWNATTTRVALSEPATAMTASGFANGTVAAWSTQASCYMMTLFQPAPGPLVGIPQACAAPHLAIDPGSQEGVLVFQSDDGVRLMNTDRSGLPGLGKSELVGPQGIEPRALWDGQRIWVSHLDARGDIVVGYMDGGHFTSTVVFELRSPRSAYDLVLIDGSVWAVSFDSTTYQADRLCVVPTSNG